MPLAGNESSHRLDGLLVEGGVTIRGNLDVSGSTTSFGAQDQIDARAFGVVADGATDDTRSLQVALSAAGLLGGTVILPVGTSLVGAVTVPANVTLRGHGYASALRLRDSANASVVNLSGTRARLLDVRILGNSAGQTSGFKAGVVITADDCTVERVRVEDTFKYGIYAANVNRPTIRNCEVIDTLYIGIYLETTGSSDMLDPLVESNRVDRSGLAAATISEGGLKVHGASGKKVLRPRIANNLVLMPASPVSAAAVCIETFGGVDNAVIDGNACLNGSIGVSCDTSDYATVTGNTSVGAKLYGIEIVSSQQPVVAGNTVNASSVALYGITVNGTSDTSSIVAITGNTVSGATSYGIRSRGATQVSIAGNGVNCTGGAAGIYVANATYASVTGNIVTDTGLSTDNGIFFDNSVWVACSGNTISGMDNNGVIVFASSAITIRAFVFANAIDISGVAQPVSTNLSGGAALSSQSQVFGASDGFANRLDWASDVRMLTGTGTPEGAVTGSIGSLFLRTDGGASTTLYVKTSGTGNTGWTAK